MQSIVLVGLNHRAAPIQLRERFSIGEVLLEGALERFTSDGGKCGEYGDEGVIPSACNRLDIYTVASSLDAGHNAVCSLLHDLCGESRAQFERIVNMLLHHPTIYLKQRAGRLAAQRYVEMARDLITLPGAMLGGSNPCIACCPDGRHC